MNRRELLKLIAAATGGMVIGGEFLLSGCNNPESNTTPLEFTEENIAFLDEVAETILPQTSTAGAKAAGVGRFMTVMANDCYTKDDQEIFHKGLTTLNDACKKMHGHDFMKATPEHKKAVLVSLDPEIKDYQAKRKEFNKEQDDLEKKAQANGDTNFKRKTMPDHYFTMMKQLTILGYFTSKEGRTGATRYEPVPGKYIGDLDYKKGDKIITGLN